MARQHLTDRTIAALRRKPAAAGERYEIMDTDVPGFGARVSDTGSVTFILNLRYPGARHPARRTLGEPGEKTFPEARVFTLADARDEARRWRGLVNVGIDPKDEHEKTIREAAQRRVNTFGAVAEDFIAAMEPTERRRQEVAQAIRRFFVAKWKDRPIVEITPPDVLQIVRAIKAEGHSHQARNVLGHARRLFSWAIAQHAYGLERSPCSELRPKQIVGAKRARKRFLTDDELRAAWNAAGTLGYPYGPLYQLLMVTGARRNEIADARRREIDALKVALVVPADRMKMDADHAIPLNETARAIIESLPTFKGGDYLFTSGDGSASVANFGRAKQRLDEAMAAELGRKPDPFKVHDLRRTVRTNLSALPIPNDVAERMIAHGDTGQGYNRWSFLEEKRVGFDLWGARLQQIVSQSDAGNVLWTNFGKVTG